MLPQYTEFREIPFVLCGSSPVYQWSPINHTSLIYTIVWSPPPQTLGLTMSPAFAKWDISKCDASRILINKHLCSRVQPLKTPISCGKEDPDDSQHQPSDRGVSPFSPVNFPDNCTSATPGETSRRTTQLSSAQTDNPQDHGQIYG